MPPLFNGSWVICQSQCAKCRLRPDLPRAALGTRGQNLSLKPEGEGGIITSSQGYYNTGPGPILSKIQDRELEQRRERNTQTKNRVEAPSWRV